jgi:hypothetical protein
MPTGAFPAAKPARIVGTDPRASMPPGSYPAAPPITDPSRIKDQSRVASMDGFVPQGIIAPQMVRPEAPGTYPAAPRMSPFGNVGQEFHKHGAPPTPSQYRNEMPPAAPHMGTPASQTAQTETQPSFWQQGGDLFNQASTAVEEKLQEHREAVQKYGPETVLKVLEQRAGNVPGSLTNTAPRPGGGPEQRYIPPQFAPPAQQTAQAEPTAQDLMALIESMKAKGATPEEIAFVQSLVNSQVA